MDDSSQASPQASPSTNWSLILTAQSSSPDRNAALAQLCRLYWQPLYVYARRRGLSPVDAEDATQDFFAKILEQDWLARVNSERGRFRGFLFQSMSYHLSQSQRDQRTQKRGGGATPVSLDTQSAEQRHLTSSDPAAIDAATSFDRTWATTILDHAWQRLQDEERQAGRLDRFTLLQPFLTQPPGAGEYERLALELGLARPTVAVHVHRLGKRYRELIRLAVADTVLDRSDLESELRHLLQCFSESPPRI